MVKFLNDLKNQEISDVHAPVTNYHNPFYSGKKIYSELDFGSYYDHHEHDAIKEYLLQHSQLHLGFSSTPEYISDFELAFAEALGVKYAIAMANAGLCIDTLIAFARSKIPKGKPPVAFTQSINYKAVPMALVRAGFEVNYLDSAPNHINPGVAEIKGVVDEDVDVLFLTHMNGYPVESDRGDFGQDRLSSLLIFEDCARSLGAKFRGISTGAIFDAGVHSFHSKKIISTLGEGGMISTNREDIRDFAMRCRQYGLEDGLGSNYKLTELQAIVGTKQIEKLASLIDKRRAVVKRYIELLSREDDRITIIESMPLAEPVPYVLPLLLGGDFPASLRPCLFDNIRERFNIELSVSNPIQPLRWPSLRPFIGSRSVFRNCMQVNERLLALPVHPSMSDSHAEYVVSAFLSSLSSLLK